MLRRSLAALWLVAAVALGWGLPHGAVDTAASLAASSLAHHSIRAVDASIDASVAVVAPVVEAIAPHGDHRSPQGHTREVLGATTVAVALLLLVARRRFSVARTHALRVAVVAHGGRAPPV